MLESLAEVIVFIVLGTMGAFIRWGFTGFKNGRFEVYFKQESGWNAFISILFIISIVVIVQFLKN